MDNLETIKAKQKLWRGLAPDLVVILWGLGGGVLLPLAAYWFIPRETCHSQYLSSFPAGALAVYFFYIYPWVGIVIGIIVLVLALKGRPDWLILVHGPIILGVSIWLFVVSGFLLMIFMTTPQEKGQIIVEGRQYVLTYCIDFQLEGGDVGLYRCDDETQRSCQLLTTGSVGMMQDPSLRYEDGNLIVDNTLFGPLIYPLDND